jgi:hypothetical protein
MNDIESLINEVKSAINSFPEAKEKLTKAFSAVLTLQGITLLLALTTLIIQINQISKSK